jgi:hypothetical protein
VEERSFWYLATTPLSVPYWTEVVPSEVEVGGEAMLAPMLFSSRESAEAELRRLEGLDADAYLRAREEYGEELIDAAYDTTPSLEVFEMSEWLLRENLSDSEIIHVMLDNRLKPARDLLTELG